MVLFAVNKSFDRHYLVYDNDLQTARFSHSDFKDFLRFSLQSFGELQIQEALFGEWGSPNTSQDGFRFVSALSMTSSDRVLIVPLQK